MKKIEELNLHLRRTEGAGLFHDSRQDARALAKVLNQSMEKINELAQAFNQLAEANARLEDKVKKLTLPEIIITSSTARVDA